MNSEFSVPQRTDCHISALSSILERKKKTREKFFNWNYFLKNDYYARLLIF